MMWQKKLKEEEEVGNRFNRSPPWLLLPSDDIQVVAMVDICQGSFKLNFLF